MPKEKRVQILSKKTAELKKHRANEVENMQYADFTQSIKHALDNNKGIFFFHEHDHVGSYNALGDLIPELAQKDVKYILVEKAVSDVGQAFTQMNNQASIEPFKQQVKKLNPEYLNKPYVQESLKFYQKALNAGIKLIPVGVNSTSQDAEMLLERVTDNEAEMLRNIKSEIEKDQSKFIGIFGRVHISMAFECQVPAYTLISNGKSDQEWNITHSQPQWGHYLFIPQNLNEKDVRTTYEGQMPGIGGIYVDYTEELSKMPVRAFSMPASKSNVSNSNCFWTTVAVTAVGAAAIAATMYFNTLKL